MSPTIILIILLALATAGDALLAKLYVGAKEEVARVQQAFDSFKADVKVMGEKAEKDSAEKKAANIKSKESADAENAATVARLTADIGKLRRERDSSRRSVLSAAPAGSKCPPEQACFDRAAFESALRDYRAAIRGLADEAAALEADLNTAKKWAQDSPR